MVPPLLIIEEFNFLFRNLEKRQSRVCLNLFFEVNRHGLVIYFSFNIHESDQDLVGRCRNSLLDQFGYICAASDEKDHHSESMLNLDFFTISSSGE